LEVASEKEKKKKHLKQQEATAPVVNQDLEVPQLVLDQILTIVIA
jgi:hypothetical protein